MSHRFASGLLIAAAVLVAGLLVAFAVGRYPVGLGELFDVLWSRVTGQSASVSDATSPGTG